jgi:choline dehydrogenase-like flavoprotein
VVFSIKMLRDARDLPDGTELTSQLCIIGAGAAGISLALQFRNSGIDVLLLESGGLAAEPSTQSLYEGHVQDEHLHSPLDRYRQRRFGGTTTIWGGRCMPFDPIDFEVRDYLPHSGWPIGLADLMPFYPQANRLCEAGPFNYRVPDVAGSGGRPMIRDFHSDNFSTDRLERFSCPTDFGARYGHKLASAANITLMLHANVTSIGLDPTGGRVESLTIRTLEGKQAIVRAGEFVLAAGGLESARLLLASRDVHRNGIGNAYDVLGRYYMCHIAGTIGTLRIDRPLGDVHHGYDIDSEGVYWRRRLALREGVQKRQGLANFIARLHHPRIIDPVHRSGVLSLLYLAKPFIPYEYAKRLHGEGQEGIGVWCRHVLNVARTPQDAFGFAWHMLRDRKLAERKFPSIIVRSRANLFSLDFHAEQAPNPESRVTLAGDRDALGMLRLLVEWRYTRGDVESVSRTLALLAADLEAQGIGRFDYDPASVEAEMTRYGAYGGHHIGTVRMGASPRYSVVDAHCRVHGVANLFVASAAVFPTSSQANPTLTIVALALRLAAHLDGRLRVPGVLP